VQRLLRLCCLGLLLVPLQLAPAYPCWLRPALLLAAPWLLLCLLMQQAGRRNGCAIKGEAAERIKIRGCREA
jgi:hypothetical protein